VHRVRGERQQAHGHVFRAVRFRRAGARRRSPAKRVLVSGKGSLSGVFAGQNVGIKEVSFLEYDLGFFDNDEDRVELGPNPFAPDKVLPTFPEKTVTHVSGMDLETMARRSGLEPPTAWFEVTRTNSTFQRKQPLATLAALANPT